MKFSAQKLFFIPGLCWGGLWIKEFFLYPELWFFVYCAAGVGVGFLVAEKLKSFHRDLWGMIALAVLALLPVPELHSAVFPLVFGYYCRWALTPAESQWQDSRSFGGGFLLGAVSAVIVDEMLFMPVLLFCTAWSVFDHWKRVAAAVSAIMLCIFSSSIRDMYVTSPVVPRLLPGAAISAVSWVEPGEKPPAVVFFGGDQTLNTQCVNDFSSVVRMFYQDSVASVPTDSDVIFVMNVSALGDGGIRECARKLKSGGVLVVPVAACGAMPAWDWIELPGSNGAFAVAGKGRKLQIDPDKMDHNFFALFKKNQNSFCPGALAGMLICEQEKPIPVRSFGNSRILWLAGMIFMLAVLLADFLFRLRRCEYRKDMLASLFNTGGHALLTAILLPQLLGKYGIPGVTNLLIALGAVWFVRRATGARQAWSKNMLWAMFFVFMICAFFAHGEIFMFAALICGGSAYVDLDGELQSKLYQSPEPDRFLAIACGIALACLLILLDVPLMYQMMIALGVRFYSWLRN